MVLSCVGEWSDLIKLSFLLTARVSDSFSHFFLGGGLFYFPLSVIKSSNGTIDFALSF